jgi:hypothetical protein
VTVLEQVAYGLATAASIVAAAQAMGGVIRHALRRYRANQARDRQTPPLPPLLPGTV